jgi:dihydrofolate reductase
VNCSIVVAVAENGVIGNGNQLPWRLPDDLRRFKELTLGKPMVMGRRTYDSIGRPLPGRTSIVVTRQQGLRIDGCIVVNSLEAALDAAGPVPEVVIVGGAELYQHALPRVDLIHLTRVHASIPGDTFFPELDPQQWHEATLARHPVDDRHAHAFSFIELARKHTEVGAQ